MYIKTIYSIDLKIELNHPVSVTDQPMTDMKENMKISLIGGIDRLDRHYREAAQKVGIDLSIYSQSEVNLSSKIKHADAVVMFTNKISHQARIQVMNMAKTKNIPVHMFHSCGVCTLRDCLNCLVAESL